MRLLGFDLETTGIDTSTARIWQVATNEREWIVNPGVPIPDEVRELCRIDDALMARIQLAPVWADVQAEVLEHLCSANALVTMNGLAYDLPVIRAHIGHAIRLPPVIDVRVLAVEILPDIADREIQGVTYTGHKLSNLALELGLVTAETLQAAAHDARFDCVLTLKAFHRLREGFTSLKTLLAYQEAARALQERDWQRFGVVPEDGPRFLWFRTCRACKQDFCGRPMKDCPACWGIGIVHQTKKKRGQPVERSFIRWMREKVRPLPLALQKP
jgi:DNA polymerase III epsilon subunit-like protein